MQHCLLCESRILPLNHLNCIKLLEKVVDNYNIDLLTRKKKECVAYHYSNLFFMDVFFYYKSPLPFFFFFLRS